MSITVKDLIKYLSELPEDAFIIESSLTIQISDKIKNKIDKYGDVEWLEKNEYHRDGDLPAMIWNDGSKFWYNHGLAHRDGDFPAKIYGDGDVHWYKNGKYYDNMNIQKLYPLRTQSVRELCSITILVNFLV